MRGGSPSQWQGGGLEAVGIPPGNFENCSAGEAFVNLFFVKITGLNPSVIICFHSRLYWYCSLHAKYLINDHSNFCHHGRESSIKFLRNMRSNLYS